MNGVDTRDQALRGKGRIRLEGSSGHLVHLTLRCGQIQWWYLVRGSFALTCGDGDVGTVHVAAGWSETLIAAYSSARLCHALVETFRAHGLRVIEVLRRSLAMHAAHVLVQVRHFTRRQLAAVATDQLVVLLTQLNPEGV